MTATQTGVTHHATSKPATPYWPRVESSIARSTSPILIKNSANFAAGSITWMEANFATTLLSSMPKTSVHTVAPSPACFIAGCPPMTLPATARMNMKAKPGSTSSVLRNRLPITTSGATISTSKVTTPMSAPSDIRPSHTNGSPLAAKGKMSKKVARPTQTDTQSSLISISATRLCLRSHSNDVGGGILGLVIHVCRAVEYSLVPLGAYSYDY